MKRLLIPLLNSLLFFGLLTSNHVLFAAQAKPRVTKPLKKIHKKNLKVKTQAQPPTQKISNPTKAPRKKHKKRRRNKNWHKKLKKHRLTKASSSTTAQLTSPNRAQVIAKEISLFQQGVQSNFLNDPQKNYVQTKLLPTLLAEQAGMGR